MSPHSTISTLKHCLSSLFTTCNQLETGSSARAESTHAPKSWSLIRKAVAAVALAGTLGAVCPTASAATVHGSNEAMRINGGVADFGSGLHLAGTPVGAASIAWDYSVVNGQIMATARVRGVLFWDAIDPGIAQAIVEFKRLDGSVISSQAFQTSTIFSPGGNANFSANQRLVDIQRSSTTLHSVTVRLFQVLPAGSRPTANQSSIAPRQFTHSVIFENGHADFGRGIHAGGTPTLPATVTFTRTNGIMSVNVRGTLYWDNFFGSGTALMDIDFLDQTGARIFGSPRISENGTGGNANLLVNQTSINETGTSGRLSAVRLKVGELVNGTFQSNREPVTIRFND